MPRPVASHHPGRDRRRLRRRGEDGSVDALILTPGDLGAKRDVARELVIDSALHQAGDWCVVADAVADSLYRGARLRCCRRRA